MDRIQTSVLCGVSPGVGILFEEFDMEGQGFLARFDEWVPIKLI